MSVPTAINSYVNPDAWDVDDAPDDGVLTFEKVLCLSESAHGTSATTF